MRNPVSRRSFLLASAGVVLGAAACSSDSDDGPEIEVSKKDTTTLPVDLSLVVASYVHTAGIDERITLALIRGNGPYNTTDPIEFAIDGAPVKATRYSEGILLPYYLVRQKFAAPGIKEVTAKVGAKTLKAALQVTDMAGSKVPVPGQPMPKVASPTVADNKGVNPVCTKRPAPCPLHDVSLDAALGEGKPLAVLFATPALCQSQLCGPVLDNLLAARDEFSGKVRMLHVEIYTDLSGKTLNPTVAGYKMESEPFLFLVGADGNVKERLDNAYDKVEVREALSRLTA